MADSAPPNLENAVVELNRMKVEIAELIQKQRMLEAQLKAVTNTFVFPFLGLSRELRDMVYKLLFNDSDPILIPSTASCYRGPYQRKFPVALFRTCRQIYNEALATLYGGNQVFQFCGDECLSDFLAGIGKAARETIRSLDISFEDGPNVGIHALLRDCKALRTLKLRMHRRNPLQGHDWRPQRGLEDLSRLRGLETVEFGRFAVLCMIVSNRDPDFVIPDLKQAGLEFLGDGDGGSDILPDHSNVDEPCWFTGDSKEGKELREKLTRPRTT